MSEEQKAGVGGPIVLGHATVTNPEDKKTEDKEEEKNG